MDEPRECRLCKRPLPLAAYPVYKKPSGDLGHLRTCQDCRTLQKTAWRHRNIKKDRKCNRERQKKYRVTDPTIRARDTEYRRAKRHAVISARLQDFAERGLFPAYQLAKKHPISTSRLCALAVQGIVHSEKWKRFRFVDEDSLKTYLYK